MQENDSEKQASKNSILRKVKIVLFSQKIFVTLYIQKGRRGKSCPLTTAIIKRLTLRAWGKK